MSQHRLFSFDVFQIQQTSTEPVAFTLFDDGKPISEHSDVQGAIHAFFERFNEKRSSLLERVKDPALNINISIK